jgi:hypothetical protein
MHLALPLPSSDERTVNITVVAVDGSKMPTLYAVQISKRGRFLPIVVCGQERGSLPWRSSGHRCVGVIVEIEAYGGF